MHFPAISIFHIQRLQEARRVLNKVPTKCVAPYHCVQLSRWQGVLTDVQADHLLGKLRVNSVQHFPDVGADLSYVHAVHV